MKIKCRAEDFQVEELPIEGGGGDGPFVLYRLTKTGIGTPEAVDEIRRRWNLDARSVQAGGLKDRHARTVQYLTIAGGPDRSISTRNLELEPVGRSRRPYGPSSFRGNRFTLVIRDMGLEDLERARRVVGELPGDGVPNYFDDQRFGSVTTDGEFIAEAWLKGDHEKALELAIVATTPHDRPADREVKEILRRHWRDWTAAKAALPRSSARSLVTYLVDHPADFRGAFARVKRDLRSIYFSAFQSELWNRMLGRWIERRTTEDTRIEYRFRTGSLPLPRGWGAEVAREFAELRLPFPSARNTEPAGEVGELTTEVLGPRGLEWKQLRVKHLDDVFLGKGDRAASFQVEGLESSVGFDELYRGRSCMRLSFELPRGAYATLVVKRIATGAGGAEGDEK